MFAPMRFGRTWTSWVELLTSLSNPDKPEEPAEGLILEGGAEVAADMLEGALAGVTV
jgi:hypothetical protein